MTGSAMRVTYIDGIRGWAALSVLLFHIFWETFGQVLPTFRSEHLRFVLAGHLAVCIFFVLSGDALATPFIQTGRVAAVVTTAVRRYFRLTVPILLVCTLSFVLMKANATLNHEAARVLHRQDWLGAFLNFGPTYASLVQFATFGVFTGNGSKQSYNPFLWTMPIEMLGSVLVFTFLFVMPSLRRPLWVAGVIALFLIGQGSYLGLFFVGVGLALLRAGGTLDRLAAARWGQPIAGVLLIALYLYYCYGMKAPSVDGDLLVSCALVALLYMHRGARRLFSNRVSRFLGFISFPVYLVHFAVLVTFTSAGALYLHDSGQLTSRGALVVGAASALLSVVVAYGFARLEARLQALTNRWLGRMVLMSSAEFPPVAPRARQDREAAGQPVQI